VLKDVFERFIKDPNDLANYRNLKQIEHLLLSKEEFLNRRGMIVPEAKKNLLQAKEVFFNCIEQVLVEPDMN
jgi:hypothetical protein